MASSCRSCYSNLSGFVDEPMICSPDGNALHQFAFETRFCMGDVVLCCFIYLLPLSFSRFLEGDGEEEKLRNVFRLVWR